MAYVPDNLLLMFSPISGALPRVFIYYNADADSNTTITGAGWVTDGFDKGLRKGDLVDAIDVGTPKHKRYQVTATATKASPATTLQAVTAIT